MEKTTTKIDLAAYCQIWRMLVRHPVIFVGLCTASLLAVLCEGLGLGLILPLLNNAAIDIGFFTQIPLLAPLNDFADSLTLTNKAYLAAAILVGTVFMRGVFFYLSQWLSILLRTRIMRETQSRVFRQLQEVELRFIHGERMGDLLVILNYYPYQIGRLVLDASSAITDLFIVLIYTILTLFISWQLTLAAIGLLLGVAILVRKLFAIRIDQASTDTRESMKQLRSLSLESLSGMKLIHLFSQEKQSLARFKVALQMYLVHSYRTEKLVALTRPLSHLLNVSVFGLLLVISTFVLSGQIEIWMGQMALFLAIASRLMRPAVSLTQVQARIAQQYPALQATLAFLNRGDKPYLRNGRVRFDTLKEGIRLEDVTFRYDVHEADTLKNVTFDIPKGKVTAVVGASGAGKSTLVNLLARLYDCESGQITVDGIDLRNLDITSWRSRIAIVSQDTFIFNDTVWANLRLAKETASDDEIYQAARLAQAHDFVMALPQGYDTVLGDRGVRLSGGQQQRIAIARAILVDPQILILDEATSELDSETECAIRAAIVQYGLGRTVLVIAHRLSTISHADNIVVLDQGRLVEQGTHRQLIRQGGHYWQLIQAQDLEIARGPISNVILDIA